MERLQNGSRLETVKLNPESGERLELEGKVHPESGERLEEKYTRFVMSTNTRCNICDVNEDSLSLS